MTTPYDTLSAKLSEVTQLVIDILNAAKPDIYVPAPGLPELAVYYGEQKSYPTVPSIAVEPADKDREFAGAPRVFKVPMRLELVIYLANVVDSAQVTRKAMHQMAERVEDVLHRNANRTLGGKVIHLFVSSFEAGYAYKGDTTYVAARLTLSVESKQALPYQ